MTLPNFSAKSPGKMGAISEERINQSVRRILKLRLQHRLRIAGSTL